MAVNPGELLVGFIGLQATPTTIGAAVQGAVQNGSYSAADLGVAALNGTSAMASFGATLANISGPLATKALGGLAGAAALAGLANDASKMSDELNNASTGNKISDSTLLPLWVTQQR
ncbi:MAG TPA: hypothetical protein VN283_06845 [Thiobacillus sp.]|nr:hypothetical protein [Thiobacillus sp.]